ncbi:helix-turn-helix transcriptional regulator [Streptomyces sp. WMMC500]|uniref:helix-turn-helix domain-containing protein n=1 Tax=Streptomyces sp. WMMC500 TaxID=3015154 RepID=UPI00248B2857|nr:helix-turn-helix transcriptional regulator [Streptomyces sp. WMMC500]WBB59943.1 helix-turn-helix transcriptional regulator [Streptomyces sp. WMMC500]
MVAKSRELHPDRSARDLYGSEIRRYRNNAGMSLEALSGVVMYSRAHLSRIETAEVIPPPDLSDRLDACFGTDGHFGRLYGIARHEVHPDKYKRRMQLEERARIIEEYSGYIVPGLVQTEEYARAVFRASNPEMSADEVEDRVAARLGRQQILKAATPPYLSVILDEAVIRRPIGGPAVMRTQLAGLLPLADTAHTIVQVLPFAHGEHGLMGGSLTLLTIDDAPVVAYEEGITTGHLIETSESARKRRRAYDLLRAYALSPRDTAAVIRSAMEALSP